MLHWFGLAASDLKVSSTYGKNKMKVTTLMLKEPFRVAVVTLWRIRLSEKEQKRCQ